MSNLLRKYKSLFSTTTSASFSTGTGETITLNSVVGLPTTTEITLTFDRVDSAGTATPTKMERIIGTISGSNLVIRTSPSSGRGADNTTEQAHSSGCVVEMIWNAKDLNDIIDHELVEHNDDGTHKAATVTTLKASGAEVNTGTEDAKIVTPKAIADSTIARSKAAGSDITTGTDDSKYVTSKAIKDAADGLVTLTDVTTNDASTTKHGFLKKLNNSTANFMRGDGAWAAINNQTRSINISPTECMVAVGTPTLTVLDNMGAFWAMDGTASEGVGYTLILPADWVSGLTVNIYWQKTTAAAGNVALLTRYTDFKADGGSGITAADHQDTTVITAGANTNLHISSVTFTPTGGAVGRFALFMFGRDAANVGDTYDGVDIRIYGASLSYTSNQ